LDAISKLQALYETRDNVTAQIEQIEKLLGAEPGEVKQRRARGPNKKKQTEIAPPTNAL
jgi:hypothetical protein